MSGVLWVLAAALATGLPFAAGLAPSLGWRGRIGAGLLAGLLSVALVLFLFSLAGVAWAPLPLGLALAVIAAAAILFGARRAAAPPPPRRTPLSLAVDGVVLLILAGYAVVSTAAEPWEWDFWAIWGLKGRVFLEAGGIDAAWLSDPDHAFAHPDYPPLVPLLYAGAGVLGGGWNGAALGWFTVAFGVALFLVLRDVLDRWLSPPVAAALAGLTLAVPSLSRHVGLADGAVAAWGTAGLVLMAMALREGGDARPGPGRDGMIALGAILLGGAAFAKNEGVALLAAGAAAMLLTRAGRLRDVLRLWPALLIAGSWQAYRLVHRFPTDLLDGGGMSAGERIALLPGLLLEFLPHGRRIWLAAVLAALAVAGARRLREHRFLLAAAGIQLAFYVGAYLVTPWPLRWHVQFSWPRLVEHLAPSLAFVAALVLAEIVVEGVKSAMAAPSTDD